MQSPGFGGLGNAVMLWFLLDSLGKPGHADYFHDHQDDPSYRQWRAEADSRAAGNPELRAKLNALDNQLTERSGQPRDPGAPPPDVAVPNGNGGISLWPVAVLGVGFVVLWRVRRRRTTMAGTPLKGAVAAPASPYRLGMTVTLDPAPFLLAGAATKVQAPNVSGDGTVGVEAIGRMEAGEMVLDRLYLPEEQGFLQ